MHRNITIARLKIKRRRPHFAKCRYRFILKRFLPEVFKCSFRSRKFFRPRVPGMRPPRGVTLHLPQLLCTLTVHFLVLTSMRHAPFLFGGFHLSRVSRHSTVHLPAYSHRHSLQP